MVIHKPRGKTQDFRWRQTAFHVDFISSAVPHVHRPGHVCQQSIPKYYLNNVKCKRSRLTNIIQHEYQLWPRLTVPTFLTMSWKPSSLSQNECKIKYLTVEIKHHFNILMANAFLNQFFCFPRPVFWPRHNFTMSGCMRASCTTSRPSKHVTASNSPGDSPKWLCMKCVSWFSDHSLALTSNM